MPTVYDRLGTICPTVVGCDMRDWWQLIYTHLAEFDTNYATNRTSLTTARQLLNRLQASNTTNIATLTSARQAVNRLLASNGTNITALTTARQLANRLQASNATNIATLTSTRQAVNRLLASNGTNITALGKLQTAVNELLADGTTNYTSITSAKTLLDEIRLDSATNYTAVSQLKTALLYHPLNYVNIRTHTAGVGVRVGNALSSNVEAVINGVIYSIAATQSGFATPTDSITACATTGAERVYTFQISSAGTLTHTTGAVATGAPGVAVIPLPTAGRCPLGHVRIRLDAGALTNFIGGTTTLMATQISTVTYTNVYQLPAWIGDYAPALTAAVMSAPAAIPGSATISSPAAANTCATISAPAAANTCAAVSAPAAANTCASVSAPAAVNTCTAMSAPAAVLATTSLPTLVVEEASKSW